MGLSGCVIDSVCGSLKVYNNYNYDHKYYYHSVKVSLDRLIPKCIRPGGHDNIQCHHKLIIL